MSGPLRTFNKMLARIVWHVLLLCIFQFFVAENAALQVCPESNVKCFCGDSPNQDIEYFPIQNFPTGADDCHDLMSAVCASHSCLYNPNGTSEDETKEKKTSKTSLYPLKIVLPPLDEEAEGSRSKIRHRRFPKSCNDSISPIRNAVMDCSVWPEFIACEINCTHGYATTEGGQSVMKTTRKCRESESAWQPKASFPVCEPYINCKAILVKPGDLECKTSGPIISYCDISCEPDEDKDAVPKNRYECLDENFAKTLPHCATIDKNVNLIPRPKTSQDSQKTSQDSLKAPQDSQKAPQAP